MVEKTGGQDGRGWESRYQNALFYVDKGMIESSDPGWLQGFYSTLVGLFHQVGLRKNVRKTARTLCFPCQASGTQSEAAYEQRITGAELSSLEIAR